MKNDIIENKTELVIYESKDGNIKLDVNLENETVCVLILHSKINTCIFIIKRQ